MRPIAGPTQSATRLPVDAKAPTAPANRTLTSRKPAEVTRLRQAAQEFEAIFIEHMMKTARQPGGKSGLLPSSAAGDIYRDMADQEMARSVAKGGGLGLGNMLLRSLDGPRPVGHSSSGPFRPISSNEGRFVGGDRP